MTDTVRPGGIILTFPIPASDQNGPADPRWQRVETLYDELAEIDGDRFARRVKLRIEQAFCHVALPAVMKALEYEDLLQLVVAAERADLGGALNRTRECLHPRTADEKLEDLIIELQRDVDDRRRVRGRDGHRKGGA